MTATVRTTPALSFDSTLPDLRIATLSDADLRRGKTLTPAGQLWERAAEMGEAGVVNSPNYTYRIAAAFFTVKQNGLVAVTGDNGSKARADRTNASRPVDGYHTMASGSAQYGIISADHLTRRVDLPATWGVSSIDNE